MRGSDQGRAPFRSWLYRIATNACLDFLARHERRVIELSALMPSGQDAKVSHVEWLQPYPDQLLGATTGDADADALPIRRETIELDVLRIESGSIAEVTAFELPPFLDAFNLPAMMVRGRYA